MILTRQSCINDSRLESSVVLTRQSCSNDSRLESSLVFTRQRSCSNDARLGSSVVVIRQICSNDRLGSSVWVKLGRAVSMTVDLGALYGFNKAEL